jgi:hypothetical protein
LLVLPLRRGASWSSDASCAAGARTTVTMHMTTRVATAAAVSSGGKATPVWVLERRVVLTAASAVATGTSEAAWSELVAPASGLTVFEDGKASVPTTTGEQSTTWTSELQ